LTHNQLEISKTKSSELVESLFETLKQTLENGEDILISGHFQVLPCSERKD
jgi:nucleoid DNA-binding protein